MALVLRHWILLTAVIAGVALLLALTWPPHRLVLDQSCAIEDPVSQASELIYGKAFWRRQQAAVNETVQAIQLSQADAERTRDQPPPPPSGPLTPYEQRMRRLSIETQTKNEVEQQQLWHDEIDWLARCDTMIVAHLKP